MFTRILLLASVGFAACSTPAPPPPATAAERALAPAPLRLLLEDYGGLCEVRIDEVCDSILAQAPSRSIARNSLFLRMRVIPKIRRGLMLANDEAVLLDLWLNARRLTHFLEEGAGTSYFGPLTSLALDAAKELEVRIRTIASETFGASAFESAASNIETFAEGYPLNEYLTTSEGEAASWPEVMSDVLSQPVHVVSTPLTHLNPTSSISDTAAAVHRVAATVDFVKTSIDALPDDVRWQTNLLLLELEENRAVAKALDSLAEVSAASGRIADLAGTLPASVGGEISQLLTEVDQKQPGLRATLDQARSTLESAGTVFESADATSKSITRTGEVWTGTVDAVTNLIRTANAPSDAPPPADPGPPFDIRDYGDTAEKLTVTAKALGAVLVQIHDLVEPTQARAILDSTDVAVRSTVTHVFWGAGLFALFVFLLALAYRFLTTRMMPRR